ncbi:MAG: ABC transporter permease [Betaproteobacteria bacterium]
MSATASVPPKAGVLQRCAAWLHLLASPDGPPKLASLMCLLLLLAAVFGTSLTPYSETTIDFESVMVPPFWEPDGAWRHPFGTDQLGRDILARLVAGAQVSMMVALAAVAVGGTLGTLIGLVAGYFGGVVGAVLSRLTEAFLALPFILMALALVAAFGPGLSNIIIVMILTNWARYARLARSEVLGIKERDFVLLARIAGVSRLRIALRHVLPNAINSVAILAILDVGRAMMLESALSFLGLGVQPPSVSWGVMLADAKSFMGFAWWLALFPGIAIFLSVLSFSALGDWLHDKFDPRTGL